MARRIERRTAAHAIAQFRRHDRRSWIIRTGLIGIALLAAAGRQRSPALVWNASASAPIGLYRVELDHAIARGDLVLAWLPEDARRLAAERRYLPANVPLVKRVAAMAGNTVCASGMDVMIDGRPVAQRRAADGQGRPLPAWSGCRVLGSNEVFLLMEGISNSFDGRYFGAIGTDRIIGRLVPLWTR